MESYKSGEFNGGRGPSFYKDTSLDRNLNYYNLIATENDFSFFRGSERICLGNDYQNMLGYHDYWGKALI